MPPIHRGEDEYAAAWVNWVRGVIDPLEWKSRRLELEQFNADLLARPIPGPGVFEEEVVPRDAAGWCLYQADLWMTDATVSDVWATSRILPLIARVGRSIDVVRCLPNAESKMRVALAKGSRQLIPTLFEFAVAISYIERDWDVVFVPESPTEPRPDLRVSKYGRRLWVECKKKSVPDYSRRERAAWARLYAPIQRYVWENRPNVVFEIVFHVPLSQLPDDYLVRTLLPLAPWRDCGEVIANGVVTVWVRRPDYDSGKLLLRRNYSRWDGSPIKHHFFGYSDLWKGITYCFDASLHDGSTRYVDRVNWCAAAIWSCASEDSIIQMGNHFKRELAHAVAQLPEGEPAGIHVGIDSFADDAVEDVRLWRNHHQALGTFDWERRDVRVVYASLMKMEIPLIEGWAITETAHSWSCGPSAQPYLHDGRCIVPPDAGCSPPDPSLSPLLR